MNVPTIKEPLLAPNQICGMDIPWESVSFPRYVSIKHNGQRAATYGDYFLGRSGKPPALSPLLVEMLKPVLEFAKQHSLLLDGEFNSSSMNTVGQTRSILAGTVSMPSDFRFKCFYSIPIDLWNSCRLVPMEKILSSKMQGTPSILEMIPHTLVDTVEDFLSLVDDYRHKNIEGFMLVDPKAYYRHGRSTLSESPLLKYKYYSDPEDGEIIGLTARQERLSSVAAKTNVFGKAEQVYTKDSFVDTDIAGCLVVRLEDGTAVNCPFPVGFTLAERQIAYNQFDSGGQYDLKGTWVSFRRLHCENRDKPISIKNVEFRDSK